MKYSVLMSVYSGDSPRFLRTALESIYEDQTRKPDEIVIVFDGPVPDDTREIVSAFRCGKENIVRVDDEAENRGLGEALRIGSALCTGDYLFRMDADDISRPTRFEKQIAYLESHPDVDVLGSDIAEFTDAPDSPKKRIRACPADHAGIVRMSRRRTPMNHVSVCIKKSALEKSGGYQSLPMMEDYYLWVRMMESGCRFANLKESLVFVRIGNGFTERRKNRIRIASWDFMQDHLLRHGRITGIEALRNRLYIRLYFLAPDPLKWFLYNKILRKS